MTTYPAAEIAATDAAEALFVAADVEFGPDWEENSRDPEFVHTVSYWDMPVATDDEREALARTIDVEEFHL